MKKRLSVILVTVIICLSLVVPAFALPYDTPISVGHLRLVDMANLIEDDKEAELIKKLDEISERQNVDIVFVTTSDLKGKTPEAYADDFFDYNDYGLGEHRDGVLFLRYYKDADNREVWISTCGYGITVFTDAGIQYIIDQLEDDIVDGNYYSVVDKFADLCDKFINKANDGEPYDVKNLPKKKAYGKMVVVSLILGLILAFIVTFSMKSKLKTVRQQAAASDYTRPDSMKLIKSRDTYLYRTVSRTAKPKSSSGGSSTHTSSSGTTHGGGGRSI